MKCTQAFAILFLFVLSLQVTAQTSNDTMLAEHSSAIQFQIRNNFTISSFQGAALSFKYHVRPSFALRVGFGASLNDGTSEATQGNFSSDTLLGSSSSTQNQNSTSIQLNTQAVWYSESSLGMLLFCGTGPFVGFSRSHAVRETVSGFVNNPQSKASSEETSTGWSVGLSGLAGVEWFASKSVSLHAEYDLSVARSWSRGEVTFNYQMVPRSSSTSESDGKSWQLTSNGVLFGLSIYFR